MTGIECLALDHRLDTCAFRLARRSDCAGHRGGPGRGSRPLVLVPGAARSRVPRPCRASRGTDCDGRHPERIGRGAVPGQRVLVRCTCVRRDVSAREPRCRDTAVRDDRGPNFGRGGTVAACRRLDLVLRRPAAARAVCRCIVVGTRAAAGRSSYALISMAGDRRASGRAPSHHFGIPHRRISSRRRAERHRDDSPSGLTSGRRSDQPDAGPDRGASRPRAGAYPAA